MVSCLGWLSPALFSVLFLLSLCWSAAASSPSTGVYDPAVYDVSWSSASSAETASMPLGNGDLTLNVWVNASTGALMYYAQTAQGYDENGQLLKLTRGRVDFSLPTPVTFSAFSQRLHLTNASITIEYTADGMDVRAVIWVDRFHPVAHFNVSTSQPVLARNSIEMWRAAVTPMGSNWASGIACSQRYVYPDRLYTGDSMGGRPGELLWYHRNDGALNDSMYDASLRQQNLTGVGLEQLDPLVNSTFGGYITHYDPDGRLWTNATSKPADYGVQVSVASLQPVSAINFDLFAHAERRTSVERYLKSLQRVTRAVDRVPRDEALRAHSQYWLDFSQRSRLEFIAGDDSEVSYRLNQVLLLQRMGDAMDGLGGAIHFNGQAWGIGSYDDSPQGPDHRQWSSAYWWQNTRMPYYPAAASGDFDILLPMFHFYQSLQTVQETRVRAYYNHSGLYYDETMTMYGLVTMGGWGYTCAGTAEEHNNNYIKLHWDGSFELCLLMVQYYRFTQNATFVQATLLPVCAGVVEFFRLHYPQRDSENRTIFFPSQSLETWQCPGQHDVQQCVTNSVIFVAGVNATLAALLTLPPSLVSADLRAVWQEQLAALPPLPKGQCPTNSSLECLLPGESYVHATSNSENVELYTVWPYGLYGLAQPDYSTILNNYHLRLFPSNNGWAQDIVDAVLLGLRAEAAAMALDRVNNPPPAPGWTYPSFVGPVPETAPALDHFSVLRVAMTWMVVQEVEAASCDVERLQQQAGAGSVLLVDPHRLQQKREGRSNSSALLLFAALPPQWGVSFKLSASGQTTIEGECVNNTLTALHVSPAERKADIVVLGCTSLPGSIFTDRGSAVAVSE